MVQNMQCHCFQNLILNTCWYILVCLPSEPELHSWVILSSKFQELEKVGITFIPMSSKREPLTGKKCMVHWRESSRNTVDTPTFHADAGLRLKLLCCCIVHCFCFCFCYCYCSVWFSLKLIPKNSVMLQGISPLVGFRVCITRPKGPRPMPSQWNMPIGILHWTTIYKYTQLTD